MLKHGPGRPLARFRTVASLALALALGMAMAGPATRACAQEIGREGNLAFGAERLFGLYLEVRSIDEGPVEIDRDTTVIGIGWGLGAEYALLTIPRLGIDYFLTDNLTLGGSFGLASVSVESFDYIGFLLAGRVGYALRLSHEITFWPRGGLTFSTVAGDADVNVFALTFEGMFTFAPADNWAFLAGPVLDLGVVGEFEEADYSEILFGIMFGIEGWVDI
jgi:hypothetical protein